MNHETKTIFVPSCKQAAVNLVILVWGLMSIDSLLEPASSGHSRNCSFWHIGLIFHSWRFLFGWNQLTFDILKGINNLIDQFNLKSLLMTHSQLINHLIINFQCPNMYILALIWSPPTAKCSTMFTSWVVTVFVCLSAVWCWGGNVQWVCEWSCGL